VSLIVTKKADSQSLVDLATVKTRLKIRDSSRDDLLSLMIEEVSSNILDYLGFPLARQSYLEMVEGKGSPRILLTGRPVDKDSLTVTLLGTAVTDYKLERGRCLNRLCGWPVAYPGLDYGLAQPYPLFAYVGVSYAAYDGPENVSVAYTAGYLLPGQVSTWTNGASLALGAWIRPSRSSLSPWLYEVTQAGSSGLAEPVYPASSGSSVTDGTAVLAARDVSELPAALRKAAALAVVYDFEQRPAGLTSQGVDSYRESYDSRAQGDLPGHVCKILDRYRSDY
jgi:Phage gp6-like head-tail connector protein